MKSILKRVYQRVSLVTLSAILSVSSLAGVGSLLLSQTVHAIGAVDITNVTQLCSAINGQADGQTWTIEPGTYALNQCNSIVAGGQTGWYLPITANNITVNGVGNPTIYGTGYTANGAWATQDLIAIFGNNVTISGLTLMPKVEPNKTIEVVGANTTIKNVTLTANTLTNPSEYANISDPTWAQEAKTWGGSIYYNNATGTQTLDNVMINNGGVSDHSPSATFNLSHLQLSYSTNSDWINDYRFYLATTSSVINGLPTYTYHVNSTLNNFDSVLAAVGDPTTIGTDTISLDSNLTTTKQITLAKPMTLNGNGNTISPTFTKTDNTNNSALGIQANDVTVNNLIEDATSSTNLHGINIYSATGINLNNVTVKNNSHDGLVVNGSNVIVNNLTTSNNGWGGVDVDKTGAVLTVNGTSHHNGEPADIYVDNASIGHVIDTNNQYSVMNSVLHANDSVYNLKPAVPTLTYPTNNSFINTNDFWFDWSDVTGAASYEFQTSQSPSTDGNGALNSGVWTGDYQHNQPTASTLHSVGATGTWYWQVRTVDTKGAKSDWSPVGKMTIDMTKPAVPNDLSWLDSNNHTAQNGLTNIQKGTLSWKDSTPTDVDHYVYKFWTNISNYFDGESNAWNTSDSQYITKSSAGGSIWTDFANKQGTYYFCVEAVDAAGNTSDCSPTLAITYDNTAPTGLANLSPSDGAYATTAGLPTIDWTNASDTSTPISYYYESSHSSAVNTDGSFVSHVYQSGALSSSMIASAGTPEGVYYWHVRAVDATGNTTAWTSPWKITVDNTAPTSTNDLGPLVHGSVTVQQHITDNFLPKSGKLRIWKLTSGGVADNTKFFAIGDVAVDASNNVTYNLNTLTNLFGDGSYVAKFTSTDQAGNASVSQVNFTVDNTAPNVTIDTLATTKNNEPTLTGTVNDPTASVVIKVDGIDHYVATNNGSGTWTFTFTSPLTDGTHTISVTATDTAGNITTPSVKSSVIVDTVPPVVSTPTYSTNGNVITPTVTASDLNTPLTYAWMANDSVSAANVTVSDTSVLEPTFTVNANNTYHFTLSVMDAAGNVSSQIFTFKYTAPVTTPAPTSNIPLANTPTTGTGFTNVAATPTAAVLGDSTTTPNNTLTTANKAASVLGASSTKTPASTPWSLAWYWWVLIVAAIITILWAIIAAIRRPNLDQM